MREIILATKNKGKLMEMKRRLKPLEVKYALHGLSDLTVKLPDCDETGMTFEENAVLKVEHARLHLPSSYQDKIIIADDSGIEIKALKGEPGVFSRRWKGYEMTDEEIISYCLYMMKGIKDRSAHFTSAYAVYHPVIDEILTFKGKSCGAILETPLRESLVEGLPFRSLFFVPEFRMMFHEVKDLDTNIRGKYRLGQDTAMGEIVNFLLKFI